MFKEEGKRIIAKYYESLGSGVPSHEVPRVHVDEIASKVAAFYEKIRNVVDYHEEHLLRKRFIDRVLRRRLILNLDESVAEAVVKEVIRAGHLKNDTVPETKVHDVERIIDSLRCLLHHLPPLEGKEKEENIELLYTVTASAIEDCLFPPREETILAELMFTIIKKDLVIRGEKISEEEIDSQLFVAIQRALLQADENQLRYRLLKFIYPYWDAMAGEECAFVGRTFPDTKKKIERLMKNSAAPYFFKLANRYNTVFYLLGDMLKEFQGAQAFEEMAEDPEHLEREVRLLYDRRLKKARRRLNRIAFLSVLSFFISKIAVALAVEIPAEVYLTGSFSIANTLVNIAFPPFLMLLIVLAIKLPSKNNANLVLQALEDALYEGRNAKYIVDVPRKRRTFFGSAVYGVYLLTFVVTFYFITRFLLFLDFNVANIVIFIFFVSLVSAAGVKIHNRSRELSLEAKNGGMLSFLFDLFAMPLVALGRWIIDKLARFNPLVVAINLLIEAPFQIVIEFLESFRGFIKSKKEEIR